MDNDEYTQFRTECPECDSELYVRGQFFVADILLETDGFDVYDGLIQEGEDVEVYCKSCDFVRGIDKYVEESEAEGAKE